MQLNEIHEMMSRTTDEFLSDIQKFFPNNNRDIEIVKTFSQALGEKLSKHISNYVLQYRSEIEGKDAKFFRDNKKKIFMGLPDEKVDHFENLIFPKNSKSETSQHNINMIWNYFEVYLFLSGEFQKHQKPLPEG